MHDERDSKGRRKRPVLTAEDVAEIRRMAAEGVIGKAIAARMGVSPACISRILTGKRHAAKSDAPDAC